jgi:hypothetical protein
MKPDAATATKLVAIVAFSGEFGDPEFTNDPERDCDLDPDRAADELRQAGYEVHRLPKKYFGHLYHPLDDFIEAMLPGSDDPTVIDAVWKEVQAIVWQYGGDCTECGPREPDYVPLDHLWV